MSHLLAASFPNVAADIGEEPPQSIFVDEFFIYVASASSWAQLFGGQPVGRVRVSVLAHTCSAWWNDTSRHVKLLRLPGEQRASHVSLAALQRMYTDVRIDCACVKLGNALPRFDESPQPSVQVLEQEFYHAVPDDPHDATAGELHVRQGIRR